MGAAVALPPGIPKRMARLDVNPAGYPIPWFVDRTEDPADPDFRLMDPRRWKRAVKEHRCWVCGDRIKGAVETFVIGPMCAVNLTTSEPPCHDDCADWSARACPFLANPKKRRRTSGVEDGEPMGGHSISRNPGVVLLWKVRAGTWKLFDDGTGKPLVRLPQRPLRARWIREGRDATRAEAQAALDSGYPILEEAAMADGGGDLERTLANVQHLRGLADAAAVYLPEEVAS